MYDGNKNSLGEINAANINTSSMRNMTLKRKNALAASWSIITGGSEPIDGEREFSTSEIEEACAKRKAQTEKIMQDWKNKQNKSSISNKMADLGF